jgi:hypothetical protein
MRKKIYNLLDDFKRKIVYWKQVILDVCCCCVHDKAVCELKGANQTSYS